MERRLKERLIGAAVLAMLAVIFIPMILDNSAQTNTPITKTNIPPLPQAGFKSRIVPLPGNDFAKRRVKPEAPKQTQLATTVTPAPTTSNGASTPQAVSASAAATVSKGGGNKAPETPVQQAQTKSEKLGMTAWVVQLGSFTSEDNARNLNKKLQKAGYASYVERVSEKNGAVFRVRIGPELLRSQAEAAQKKIKDTMSLDSIVLKYP